MLQIKICGVTSCDDAELVSEAGADAIGLNFYEGSPRFVDRDLARDIIASIPKKVRKVGVFVNSTATEVCRVFDSLQLDAVQLHGDEPPPFLSLLRKRPVIRAFRCRASGLTPVIEYLHKCADLECIPRYVLMDAYYPGQYGGTGCVFDWNLIAASSNALRGIDLALAGGLTPGNIEEAIETARPHAVDVASGVESSAGIKDRDLAIKFINNARAAFAKLEAAG